MGENFDVIPDDALGIIAYRNDIPLQLLNTQSPSQLFRIISKEDGLMVLRQSYDSGPHERNSYIGGIVSEDRSKVYWVNNTNPLP